MGREGGEVSDRQQLSTNRWNSLKKCVKKKTRKFMLKLTETWWYEKHIPITASPTLLYLPKTLRLQFPTAIFFLKVVENGIVC